MSYYKALGLEREPFSTSPDPEFFYISSEHRAALTRLIIEIRLRRGLSLILGDVGTGKTTLSRKLFQMLKTRQEIIFHMIMDPTCNSEELFLDSLIRTFNIQLPTSNATILDYKEALKKYLFQKGVEENKTVVLLIDEAQKLNPLVLEVLRVLLNYETHEYKLLQLVLLAQIELLPRLKEIKNFVDRISLKYMLNPLGELETREMIEFRLRQAGHNSELKLFTNEAVREIYRYSQGYPRQITLICHQALRTLLTGNVPMPIVDKNLVRDIIAKESLLNG